MVVNYTPMARLNDLPLQRKNIIVQEALALLDMGRRPVAIAATLTKKFKVRIDHHHVENWEQKEKARENIGNTAAPAMQNAPGHAPTPWPIRVSPIAEQEVTEMLAMREQNESLESISRAYGVWPHQAHSAMQARKLAQAAPEAKSEPIALPQAQDKPVISAPVQSAQHSQETQRVVRMEAPMPKARDKNNHRTPLRDLGAKKAAVICREAKDMRLRGMREKEISETLSEKYDARITYGNVYNWFQTALFLEEAKAKGVDVRPGIKRLQANKKPAEKAAAPEPAPAPAVQAEPPAERPAAPPAPNLDPHDSSLMMNTLPGLAKRLQRCVAAQGYSRVVVTANDIRIEV